MEVEKNGSVKNNIENDAVSVAVIQNMDAEKNENGGNNTGNENVYEYNDAIAVAGNGRYTCGMMVSLSWCLLAMCIDLFSFSIVVAMAACDLDLDMGKKSFLLSLPFIGTVVTSYLWGYVCDTRGRRKTLLIGMSVSFIMSTLCAFSPNWIFLATFKLIGTCFSSCAQSGTYSMAGEKCPESVKGIYMLIMTSPIHINGGLFFTLSYFIGYLDFSFDLGFITFVPWRLLTIILALPLGTSFLSLLFYYESPKFLLNIGRKEEALEVLRKIFKRNGGDGEYPVKELTLNETGNLTQKGDTSLLRSMWEQTAPLFKPPLLGNTLLLYYLLGVLYSTNSGLYVWLPIIAKAFTSSAPADAAGNSTSEGLCNMVSLMANDTSSANYSCAVSIDPPVVIAFVSYGTFAMILNIVLSRWAARKKLLLITMFFMSSLSCFLTTAIASSASAYLYFGILLTSVCIGPIFSYYVDLYPTSFRGMASCLGVMISRVWSIIGINVIGPYLIPECFNTFYVSSAVILSGVLMSFLLPPDKPAKSKVSSS